MTRLQSRLRDESGQVLVLVAAAMLGFIAMTAFVVDVGAWFHQQRATQATVDAAALAGAQGLPDRTAATNLAVSYGTKNDAGGTITDSNVTVSTTYGPNYDTVKVAKAQQSNDFFGKIFGFSFVTVHAKATAMVGSPGEALYVAPIVVNVLHPDITGKACGQEVARPDSNPCFGPTNQTTLNLGKNGAPGAFDLLNLDCISAATTDSPCSNTNGTVGASTMADWITDGYDKYLPLGGYYSDPGAKYNGNEIDQALDARAGTELLFPIYDTLVDQGSNASYHIIGWIGFHLLTGDLQGTSGTLTGYFTRVIWKGLLPPNGQGGAPSSFGVGVIALVD
jgi:Flp pilus assembly protein TadG